jgi:hypothetical protein
MVSEEIRHNWAKDLDMVIGRKRMGKSFYAKPGKIAGRPEISCPGPSHD